MSHRLALLATLLILTVASGCSRDQPEAVFLIVVDTLRPDRLSSYGRSLYATPATDTLAADGVLFEDAFAVSSWTIPSMGAMMTSLYPTQLGLVEAPAEAGARFGPRERREQLAHTLSHEERTLAEVMREEGFATAAFVNQPGLNAADGFAQGFDDYYYPADVKTVRRLEDGDVLEYAQWPPFLQNAREVDLLLVEAFESWLAGQPRGKMFVWVHLLTPHRPYTPPPWATRRVASIKERFAGTAPTDHYDGEVITADEMVGQLLAAIDGHVGRERSVVVFTSDHGEAFGEHGMYEHGHTLHGEVTRVPLIVRAPQTPPGRRVDTTVRTIDILPTVLELAGAGDALPADARGESLVPLLAADGGHRDVYSEGMLYGPTERSFMASGKKVIYNEQSATVQLFNCLLDPGETVNLGASQPALADTLMARLEAVHAGLRRDFEQRAGAGVSRGDAEEFQKALESLGYIEGVPDTVRSEPARPDPHRGHRH